MPQQIFTQRPVIDSLSESPSELYPLHIDSGQGESYNPLSLGFIDRPTTDSMMNYSVSEGFIYGNYSVLNPKLTTNLDKNSTLLSSTNISYNQNNWQLILVIVVFVCVYCYMVYRFGEVLSQLFRRFTLLSNSVALIDNKSSDVKKVTIYGSLVGFFCISLFVGSIISQFVSFASVEVLGISVLVLLFLALYRFTLQFLMGWVSGANSLFSEVWFVNRFDITLFSYVALPFAMLVWFVDWGGWVSMIMLGVYLSVTHYRSYKLLRNCGFSFLQWILYLCTVEVWPISFLIAIIIKYYQ